MNHPEWPPVIKIKLIRKSLNIGIEPSWNDIKQTIKNVTRSVLKATETMIRWGFHHVTDMVIFNYKYA